MATTTSRGLAGNHGDGPADAGKGHVDPDLSRSWGLSSHGGDVDGVTADVAGSRGLGRHDFP